MAGKADFTAEEWSAILSSPLLAGLAVSLAEPSGLWGLLQESMASGRALLEAGTDPNSSALVRAIFADIETSEGRTTARDALKVELNGKSPAEVKEKAIAGLKQAASAVDAKAPSEAAAFKAWLNHIAERVAEAASEGGFLGFGVIRVSDAEKATLAEIASALNAPA